MPDWVLYDTLILSLRNLAETLAETSPIITITGEAPPQTDKA